MSHLSLGPKRKIRLKLRLLRPLLQVKTNQSFLSDPGVNGPHSFKPHKFAADDSLKNSPPLVACLRRGQHNLPVHPSGACVASSNFVPWSMFCGHF